jgi:quinol monooxygenase YgiN
MNKTVAVINAKVGKTREAVAAVKAMVDYGRTKHGYKGEAYMQIMGGTSGTIYLIAEWNDAATFQAFIAKAMADEGYWPLLQRAAEAMVSPPTIAFLQPV